MGPRSLPLRWPVLIVSWPRRRVDRANEESRATTDFPQAVVNNPFRADPRITTPGSLSLVNCGQLQQPTQVPPGNESTLTFPPNVPTISPRPTIVARTPRNPTIPRPPLL